MRLHEHRLLTRRYALRPARADTGRAHRWAALAGMLLACRGTVNTTPSELHAAAAETPLAEVPPEGAAASVDDPPRSASEWLADPRPGQEIEGTILFPALGLRFVRPRVLHRLIHCGQPDRDASEPRVPVIVCGGRSPGSAIWVFYARLRGEVPRLDASALASFSHWSPFEETLSVGHHAEYLGSALTGIESITIDARSDPELAYRRFYFDVDERVIAVVELISTVPADDPALALDWVQLVRAIRRPAAIPADPEP